MYLITGTYMSQPGSCTEVFKSNGLALHWKIKTRINNRNEGL